MSRAAQQNGRAIARGPGDEDEICPVCKSSRYLNPKMRFLVNPECYHKMCESCVDRTFSQGPAPCPVAGCGRTLRKARFRTQTFGDIKVEREVDIRRCVASVFNRREEEFSTLLDYNNYLEEVESLTFNLIENIDVPATEAKLAAYASQNAPTIARNTAISNQEHSSAEARQTAERETARLRREAARQEEDDERKEKEEGKREFIDKLAKGKGNADTLAAEAQKVVLKKSTARRTAAEKARQQQQQQSASQSLHQPASTARNSSNGSSAPSSDPSFLIKGLKPVEVVEPEKPYDPFGGMLQERTYYSLQDHYETPWLDNARSDPAISAGGYDIKEYYARTMLEAFAGLGCFIREEVAGRGERADAVVGTAAAAMAAGGGKRPSGSDDVF